LLTIRTIASGDDPHSSISAGEWERALERVNEELGLLLTRVPGAGHVLLRAGTREELIGAEG
jgi:hypothetical protein